MNNQTKNIEDDVIVKEEQKPFFIYRKVVKCISDGISFYTDNFLEFTLISLPFVVILSLTSTFIPQFNFISEDIRADLLNFILQISIFWLLTLLFASLLICVTFEYLNQRYINNLGKIKFISVYRNINACLPKVLLYVFATLLLSTIFASIFILILGIETERFAFEIINELIKKQSNNIDTKSELAEIVKLDKMTLKLQSKFNSLNWLNILIAWKIIKSINDRDNKFTQTQST